MRVYVVLVHHVPVAVFDNERAAEACRASHADSQDCCFVSVYAFEVQSR